MLRRSVGAPAGREPIPERVVLFRIRTLLAGLAVLVALAVVLGFVFLAQAGLTLIAIALFLAVALNPAVELFERRGLPRVAAVGAVYVLALVAFTLLGLVFIPPLIHQVTKFIDALPSLVAELTKGEGTLGFLERDYHVVERVRAATSGGGSGVAGAAAPVFGAAKELATTLLGIVVIAFLTLFMLLEGPQWRRRLIDLIPETSRAPIERVGSGIYRGIGGFVMGNLLASFLAGFFVAVVLLILGVPYAIPVGLFVALIEVVPYLGPFVATVLATGVALTEGTVPAVVALTLIGGYHLIESHTLRPLIYGRALKLSTLAILIAILLGTEVAGVLGALAAIPIAGAIQVILGEVLLQRRERAGPVAPAA